MREAGAGDGGQINQYGDRAEIPVKVGGRTLMLNIDREDIIWHYKDLNDWAESKSRLQKLDIDSLNNLDKFASFFAKTINKICECLIMHQKIPQDLFTIRDIYVEKVTDYHIDYINTHIQALLVVAKDQYPSEKERSQLVVLKEFF